MSKRSTPTPSPPPSSPIPPRRKRSSAAPATAPKAGSKRPSKAGSKPISKAGSSSGLPLRPAEAKAPVRAPAPAPASKPKRVRSEAERAKNREDVARANERRRKAREIVAGILENARKASAAGTAAGFSLNRKGKERGRTGRPPFVPTPEQRAQVEIMAGLGLRQGDIALLVINPETGRPIDERTMAREFADELARGGPLASMQVAASLFRKATGKGTGAVAAAIWWSKVRMGWRETISVEAEIRSGVLVPPAATSPEEWIATQAALNLERREPGSDVE